MSKFLSSCALALVLSGSLHAATPVSSGNAASTAGSNAAVERLDGFMRSLATFEADFIQTLLDSQGRLIEKSSGKLAIHRPNRFRWDYLEPHPQLIVADGERLWVYDPELEQATVRPLQQTLAGTPAIVLSGDGELRDSFRIEKLETRSGVDWLTLLPKRSDTDFKRVRLALRGNRLDAMELADKLGQITKIEFSNPSRNPAFANDRFVFTPPAGVDVIGNAGDASKPSP